MVILQNSIHLLMHGPVLIKEIYKSKWRSVYLQNSCFHGKGLSLEKNIQKVYISKVPL